MNTKFDADYFINKFSAIPDWRWLSGNIGFRDEPSAPHCAVGHCCPSEFRIRYFIEHPDATGDEQAQEALALERLLGGTAQVGSWLATKINDGLDPRYKHDSPRSRILAALYDVKQQQQLQNQQQPVQHGCVHMWLETTGTCLYCCASKSALPVQEPAL